MSWTPTGSILLKTDWQYTEPVTGSYFKFKHSNFPSNNSYLVAQAQFNADNSVEIVDIQELTASGEAEILCLKAIPVFSNRRIAIARVPKQPNFGSELRRVIRADLLTDSDIEFTARRSVWSVGIEVSDYADASDEVVNQSSEICTTTSINASITSIAILPVNTERKGAILQNNSASNLYIEFSADAATTSVPKLVPGSYYEIPYNFTGIINGIWDTASTTKGVIVKEFS